jgi:hypothetical protein
MTVNVDGKGYDAAKICAELPLYYPLPMLHMIGDKHKSSGLADVLQALRCEDFHTDIWCVGCNRETPFRAANPQGEVEAYRRQMQLRSIATLSPGAGPPPPPPWLATGPFTVTLICQRVRQHKYLYFFILDGEHLTKVGQTPSLEDISNGELLKFRKILGQNNYSELHRAGGLFSHGVGIGAFVYLRRIFERLIDKAKERHEEKSAPIENYDRLPMDQKIQALKDVLPKALVKHAAIYGVLSKGLHELDEISCKKFFPVIRAAIIQILEQDLEIENRRKAEADLIREIGSITSSLKK